MTSIEPNACCKLAEMADELASQKPNLSPSEFIYRLGEKAGGIELGPLRYYDLLKGGHDLVSGNGFRREFDDGSGGQVRHFSGIAVSSLTFGPKLTVWLSENIRRDPSDQPDGRLTVAAVNFTQKLLNGELLPAKAGQWIRDNVCEACA